MMRCLVALLLVLLFVLAACDATAVSTPLPTPTIAMTPLPTRTATVTPTAQPTQTPVICPTPVLVWVIVGVYELLPSGYLGPGVPGVRLIYSPIYHAGESARQIAVTSGMVGVTLTQFPPGEWNLVAESWPDGWLPAITTSGEGYPTNLFVSPDDNIVLTYYALRIAPR